MKKSTPKHLQMTQAGIHNQTYSIKSIFLSALCIAAFTLSAIAQKSTTFFTENKQGGATLYATNPELYPVSVLLTLNLNNMSFSEGGQDIFVIPAETEKYKLGEFTAAPNTKYSYSYKYKTAMGDVTVNNNAQSYVYDLPFQKGKTYRLFQGYNGSLSHTNENALDFTMPEGSEILAAREGIVVQVVENNTESCFREECKKLNNYITIMHSDGSFSQYTHIKYNGANYKPGDAVKKGDVIAYSGNVGYSSGPHLHFVCFNAGFEKWRTLETKFKIDGGDKVASLTEGASYSRSY